MTIPARRSRCFTKMPPRPAIKSRVDRILRSRCMETTTVERLFDNVLVTGGGGYCASILVPQLLAAGYKVTAYDTFFFGDRHLPKGDRSEEHTSELQSLIRLSYAVFCVKKQNEEDAIN